MDEEISINSEDYCDYSGVSLLNPEICSAILCNYSKLKQDSAENFEGDLWYLMYDFDQLSDIALKPYPLYETKPNPVKPKPSLE